MFEAQRPVRSIRLRERESPWYAKIAESFETNAALTPEQQATIDRRVEAHRVRIAAEMARMGLVSKVTRED